MKDIRVPGVAWAALIIAAIAVTHENEAWLMQYNVSPFYVDLAITLMIAALKGLNLGTEQINLALDVIDRLLAKRRTPGEGMRSAQTTELSPLDVIEAETHAPPRPNPLVRFFFG